MSCGVCGFAVNRYFLLHYNLFFNVNFGSGTPMYCGEDSLFFKALRKKTKNVYFSKNVIAEINQQPSTWFRGYDEKYFFVKAYIYRLLYGCFAWVIILRDYLLRKKNYNFSIWKIIKISKKAFKEYKVNLKNNYHKSYEWC